MQSGRFITFEGGEGTGKSTQIPLIKEQLEKAGKSVIVTREPGGSPGAELIRPLLVQGQTERWDSLTEVLLLNAARRDHIVKTIRPALDKGMWVLCDRFADSTFAYQGYGHGLALSELRQVHALIAGDLRADLTFIFNLSYEEGLKRTQGRSHQEDRYERMTDNFHARVQQGFLDIAREEPARCVVIDAAQSIQALTVELWAIINKRFLDKSHD